MLMEVQRAGRKNRCLQVALLSLIALYQPNSTIARGNEQRAPEEITMRVAQPSLASARLPVEGAMPALGKATAWLNSPPLDAPALRGKVVLVEFWTYSCINWRRSLPYVRAWEKKYRANGLVVIGVHTPEFEFEKDVNNVRKASSEMGIEYPILIDNEYSTWMSFTNDVWPAIYLIDAKGRVRYHKFGEGDYDLAERAIQALLSETGATNVSRELVSVDARGAEAEADWQDMKSLENYVGYERTENFLTTSGRKDNKAHDYAAPATLKLNSWALAGNWTVGKQRIVLNRSNGRIVYRFHARDLHLVMGPVKPNAPVRFRILVDGQPPGDIHGVDIDEQGFGIVSSPRMYQLIRQHKPIVERLFEIEFLDSGVEAYSFTFG